jgi:hypothetical protein
MRKHDLTHRIAEMEALLKLLALAKGLHVIEDAGHGRLKPIAGTSGKKRGASCLAKTSWTNLALRAGRTLGTSDTPKRQRGG